MAHEKTDDGADLIFGLSDCSIQAEVNDVKLMMLMPPHRPVDS
jgi:hypothetical protein